MNYVERVTDIKYPFLDDNFLKFYNVRLFKALEISLKIRK